MDKVIHTNIKELGRGEPMPEAPKNNHFQELKKGKTNKNKDKRNKSGEDTVQSEEMRYKNADDIYE